MLALIGNAVETYETNQIPLKYRISRCDLEKLDH
jgi:hypothetical protein